MLSIEIIELSPMLLFVYKNIKFIELYGRNSAIIQVFKKCKCLHFILFRLRSEVEIGGIDMRVGLCTNCAKLLYAANILTDFSSEVVFLEREP